MLILVLLQSHYTRSLAGSVWQVWGVLATMQAVPRKRARHASYMKLPLSRYIGPCILADMLGPDQPRVHRAPLDHPDAGPHHCAKAQ